MAEVFNSCRRKLARAKEHICDFDRDTRIFIEKQPYVPAIDPDPQRPQYQVHKLKLTEPIPDSLELIAADAVNNLRAVLDQAGYAVAVAASGRTDLNNTAFPFAGSFTQLEHAIRGRSKDIPQDILTLFRKCKPYKGGNDLLCTLNDLCNADKHKILTAAVNHVHRTRARFEGVGFFSSTTEQPIWDSVKNEVILFTTGPETEKFYGNLKFTFCIAFGEIEIISGQPAVGVLDALANEVERILLAIEAESRRIGIIA